MDSYNNISEVFELLNQAGISYLVLRNYENLLAPEMYMDGHGDVDLLCADSQIVAKLLNAKTNREDQPPFIGDGTHYYIYVGGEYVSLDLRYIGDDYYCEQWEKDLLNRRVMHNGFYVMSEEDYFYTLVYHAVLQKEFLSDEYLSRLLEMAAKLDVTLIEQSEYGLLRSLEAYMQKHSYRFVYPFDYLVPARFHLVKSKLIKINWNIFIRHKRYWSRRKIMEILVRIKHTIQRR